VRSVTEDGCHELLLRLAGRLGDRYLWRFRDWLAEGALGAIGQVLPLTLLRERIGVTPVEFGLLVDCLEPHATDPGQLTAVREVGAPEGRGYLFSGTPPENLALGDRSAVVLAAMLRGRTDIATLHLCWRSRWGDAGNKRVLLARTTKSCESPARLAGELQRVLRALGEAAPAVEVLPERLDLPGYHRDALAAAEPLNIGSRGGRREPALA
jgi:hypothetical protein